MNLIARNEIGVQIRTYVFDRYRDGYSCYMMSSSGASYYYAVRTSLVAQLGGETANCQVTNELGGLGFFGYFYKDTNWQTGVSEVRDSYSSLFYRSEVPYQQSKYQHFDGHRFGNYTYGIAVVCHRMVT